jgi:hypothetical protein
MLTRFCLRLRYRIFTDDMKCLIANDSVYLDYSRNDIPSLHEKNLFELGEDRMLTTLLLQHFPGMSLSFVPEAMCWTIVPHTMNILLSQRRRWINSTFHNMYELLKVETMCGICFLSMKMVVVMDIIVTMTLPASLLYVGYLAYLFISEPESMDTFVLIILGVTFGLQMVSFLIRSRFDYLWWFFIFTFIGIPVFYFILPIYAFTHMDDFSWGKTRAVGAEEEDDDDSKWDDQKSLKSKKSSSSKSGKSKSKQSASTITGSLSSKSKRKEQSAATGSRTSSSSGDADYNVRTLVPGQSHLPYGTPQSTLPGTHPYGGSYYNQSMGGSTVPTQMSMPGPGPSPVRQMGMGEYSYGSQSGVPSSVHSQSYGTSTLPPSSAHSYGTSTMQHGSHANGSSMMPHGNSAVGSYGVAPIPYGAPAIPGNSYMPSNSDAHSYGGSTLPSQYAGSYSAQSAASGPRGYEVVTVAPSAADQGRRILSSDEFGMSANNGDRRDYVVSDNSRQRSGGGDDKSVGSNKSGKSAKSGRSVGSTKSGRSRKKKQEQDPNFESYRAFL